MAPASRLLLASLVASALLLAPSASAMYIMTPLRLEASAQNANVGDTVDLTLSPTPDYEGDQTVSGRTLVLRYHYDTAEGQEGLEEPTQNTSVTRDIATVTLDDAQRATYAWTIPAELDGYNAFLTAVDESGQDVASGHVAVGDAPPVMMAMGGEGGGAVEGAPENAVEEETTSDAGETGDEKSAVPAGGLILVVAAVGLAAVVALRRRQ